MHKLHNNSVLHVHMTRIQNTFYGYFNLFVANIKLVYYNEKDILKSANIITINDYFNMYMSYKKIF